MLRRSFHATLETLRAAAPLLTMAALTIAGFAATYGHRVQPAGSNWS